MAAQAAIHEFLCFSWVTACAVMTGFNLFGVTNNFRLCYTDMGKSSLRAPACAGVNSARQSAASSFIEKLQITQALFSLCSVASSMRV
jgi:hypothetical protein